MSCFCCPDKEVLASLIVRKGYGCQLIRAGAGVKKINWSGKLFYIIFYADYIIYKVAKRFKPDLFLIASTYAAHVSRLSGKPHIALDDTEHAKFELLMYPPFTDVILNLRYLEKVFRQADLL